MKKTKKCLTLIIWCLIFYLLWNLGLFENLKQTSKRHKTSTMEHFLETAMRPVGTTMYIWGGGWDSEDVAAGEGASRIGLSPKWEAFAQKQDAGYDFEDYRFQREKGLDCSGYVGWVLYNTFETEPGKSGYVTASTYMAKTFADWGWGRLVKNPKEFLTGDIVSMEGHVWISLGTCVDGSVLLVHSSPPGVMVCGTVADGKESSIALELAEVYMAKHYPGWYEKYPNCRKSASYLENVSLFRWSEKTLKGAEEYQSLCGEEILDLL